MKIKKLSLAKSLLIAFSLSCSTACWSAASLMEENTLQESLGVSSFVFVGKTATELADEFVIVNSSPKKSVRFSPDKVKYFYKDEIIGFKKSSSFNREEVPGPKKPSLFNRDEVPLSKKPSLFNRDEVPLSKKPFSFYSKFRALTNFAKSIPGGIKEFAQDVVAHPKDYAEMLYFPFAMIGETMGGGAAFN